MNKYTGTYILVKKNHIFIIKLRKVNFDCIKAIIIPFTAICIIKSENLAANGLHST